jgi:hypothetical protein
MKSTCTEVERAVTGIKGARNLHWIHAFGIVDGDGRQNEDVEKLKQNGIYALQVFSVESIYYHPDIQLATAGCLAGITGDDAKDKVAEAKKQALRKISEHTTYLSRRVAEMKIRECFLQQIPTQQQIK